jgi:hypothetical protein
MDVELKKAALEVTKFQHEAQKAAAEYLAAQQRLQLGEKAEEGKIEELRLKNQKASIDLDIARQRLQRERLKTKGTQQMNQSYRLKFGAIKQADAAIGALIGGKITKDNVTSIIQLLRTAGATGIAKNLEDQTKWYRFFDTPEKVRGDLQAYKKAFQDAFKLDEMGNIIDEADIEGGADTEPDTDMPEPEEGETPAGYPPGWVSPPPTPPAKKP